MSVTVPPRSKRYTPPRSRQHAPPPGTGERAGPARRAGSARQAAPADRPHAGAPAAGTAAPGVRGARRAVAAAVDTLLVPLVVLGGAELAWRAGWLGAVGVDDAGWVAWSRSYPLVAWTVTAAAFVYHAVCTAAWGRTAGKRLMGLVVEPAGGPPTPRRRRARAQARARLPLPVAVWRAAWSAAIFAPAVLAPVLGIAGWLSLQSRQRRSLADRAAGTTVVAGRPAADVSG